MTMTEKILARASEKSELSPGENVWVDVDVLMTHDVCGPGSFGIFKKEFGENAKVLNLCSYGFPSRFSSSLRVFKFVILFSLNSRSGIAKRLSSFLIIIFSQVMNVQIAMWIFWEIIAKSRISSTSMTSKTLATSRYSCVVIFLILLPTIFICCKKRLWSLSATPLLSLNQSIPNNLQANPDYKGVCHVALAQEGHCRPGEVDFFNSNYSFGIIRDIVWKKS